MNTDVYVNDAYIPYLNAKQYTQIFFGGSSSGKSYFLAQRVVKENLEGTNWLVARNIAKTLRHSTFNEIIKAIGNYGLLHSYIINKTDMSITCKLNGKQILFAGLEDTEKLKSITPANGILEAVWIEEATETSYAAYKQLTKRLRGRSDKNKKIILSFNPILKTHWIHSEFFNYWDDTKTTYSSDNTLIVKTTYKDNMFLTPDDIRTLENENDRYYYEVYTLGNWGVLGNVIFTNWHTEDLSSLIPTFDNIYNGLDFGFSLDPNALVRFHVDMKRKKIYIFEELYKSGMHDDELAEELHKRLNGQFVTCDSAESKSIDDLCRRGIRAVPAVKGPDSVHYGIRFLQGFEIIVDIRCQNFINEIQSYHWLEDKYGNALRKPVDKDNHLLDALRYGTEPLQLSMIGGAAKRT